MSPPDSSILQRKPFVGAKHPGVSRRKLLQWGVGALILIVALAFAFRYWTHGRIYVSTDNAYVNAHTVEVAAQVGGPVIGLSIADNQRVEQNQPLFQIDPRPYELALERARAQLQIARQSVSQQGAAVSAAEAQLAEREAQLRNARSNSARMQQLVRQGFLSRQGGETAATQLATAQAAVKAAQANVEQARSALGATGEANAAVQAAEAAVQQASLDLQRTRVVSPVKGTVSNLTLRPGDMVQPGVPLFAIIGSQEFWVDANFKETELERIRPGQPAKVKVDMYPGKVFDGVVESVSGGSGTAFSLLPPQNATGNWVKVTQRVPVRVRILDPDPAHPLRIQTTATVEVKVR